MLQTALHVGSGTQQRQESSQAELLSGGRQLIDDSGAQGARHLQFQGFGAVGSWGAWWVRALIGTQSKVVWKEVFSS